MSTILKAKSFFVLLLLLFFFVFSFNFVFSSDREIIISQDSSKMDMFLNEGEDKEDKEDKPGFFAGIWENIKGWWSDEERMEEYIESRYDVEDFIEYEWENFETIEDYVDYHGDSPALRRFLGDEMVDEALEKKEVDVSASPQFKAPPQFEGIWDIVANVFKYFGAFIGIAAAIMFVYGAYMWIFSAGEPQNIKKAQGVLTWAALGLIFYIVHRLILAWFLGVLQIGGLPGFGI